MRVYFEAVEIYETVDVETAVANFLRGSAPGHNPAFAPAAPMVGSETRRVMNLRLDAERRARMLQPKIEEAPVVLDPEARQRMIDLAKRTAAALRTPDVEAEAAELERKKAGWAKTNARFTPDMSDAAVKRRLGFAVGDPEDDAHAA